MGLPVGLHLEYSFVLVFESEFRNIEYEKEKILSDPPFPFSKGGGSRLYAWSARSGAPGLQPEGGRITENDEV